MLMFSPYLQANDYMGAIDGFFRNAVDLLSQLFELFESLDYKVDEEFLKVCFIAFKEIIGTASMFIMLVGRILATRG